MDIYNSKFAKILAKLQGYKGFAITFGQITFYSVPKEKVNARWRRHEDKHKEQYRRDGFIRFIVRYLWEYLSNRLKGQSHYDAYLNISYEIEARKAEKER